MIASFLMVGTQSYAPAMVASLKYIHRCPVIQMSDLRTPPVAGVDEVVRLPFKVPLMLYRFKHLMGFPHNEMLIVDTDIVAKKHCEDVWEQEFDIALTAREKGEMYDGDGEDRATSMPFNTGVMFSRGTEFWNECYCWLAGQPKMSQNWYGDQQAVAEVAKRGHYNLLILPCAEFNWAPNNRNDHSTARFWHYKGGIRKKWMPGYQPPTLCKSSTA
jgi:hypothetical protein